MYLTPWRYQLYLLQLENYDVKRFWVVLKTKGFFPPFRFSPRQKIEWTAKIKAIFLMALLFATLLFFEAELVALHYSWIFSVGIFLVIYFLTVPFWIMLAVQVLDPVDVFLKKRLVARARAKISTCPNLKIIGIAGSYGKTTVKEFITTALNADKSVLKTPENINTPVGIARLILKSDLSTFDIFVVEMGEYMIGDVQDICKLTPPDVAIVTGINEAHAERMGGVSNAQKTIFEVVEHAKPNAVVYVNGDDHNCVEYARNLSGVKFYGSGSENTIGFRILENSFDEGGLIRKVVIGDATTKYEIFSKLSGSYVAANAGLALAIARYFKLDLDRSAKELSTLRPVPHRLQIVKGAGDVVVVDDSYNGNPTGVHEAIKLLSEFKKRRKIFLTPGLVEMGTESQSVHEKIGEELEQVVDLVILIKNSATPFIAAGLEKAGFAKDKILWFNSAVEAHAALGTIVKPQDVILFQNDWTDNYL